MSASAYKAAYTLSTSQVLYFNTLKSDEGYPLTEPELVQEEMVSGGADGSRDRDIHLQFRKWIFRTSADAANLALADEIAKQYERAQQAALVGTLRLERGGVFRSYPHLKIMLVSTRVIAGSSTGFGSESVSNALIYAQWTTKFTKPQST